MAVGPEGHVLLVSKGRRGPIALYHIPAEKLTEDSVLVRFAGTLNMPSTRQLGRLVTGAAISPSGWVPSSRKGKQWISWTRTTSSC
jgi:hypothetical protein